MPFDAFNQGAGADKPKKWTLDMSLELARSMEPFIKPLGFQVMLAGSVFYKGESAKNLNLIFMPITEPANPGKDLELLTWLGETLGKGSVYRYPKAGNIYRHYMTFKFDGLAINTMIG